MKKFCNLKWITYVLLSVTFLIFCAFFGMRTYADSSGSIGWDCEYTYESETKTLTIRGTSQLAEIDQYICYDLANIASWDMWDPPLNLVFESLTIGGDGYSQFFREFDQIENVTLNECTITVDMDSLFESNRNLITLQIHDPNLQNITSMNYLCADCESLESVVIDVVNSPGSNDYGISLDGAFSGCRRLRSVDLSGMSPFTSSYGTFDNCTSLEEITIPKPSGDTLHCLESIPDTGYQWYFEQDPGTLYSVSEMSNEFADPYEAPITVLRRSYDDSLPWYFNPDTKTLYLGTNDDQYYWMDLFQGRTFGIYETEWPWHQFRDDIREVKVVGHIELQTAESIFVNCFNLRKLYGNIDFSDCYNYSSAFTGCIGLVDGDESGLNSFIESMAPDYNYLLWDSTEVRYDGMFSGCSNLFTISLENFRYPDHPMYVNCVSMFSNCENLTSVTMSNPNLIEPYMIGMFYECTNLVTFNVREPNIIYGTGAAYFENMFYHCESLKNLDFTAFAPESSVRASSMFEGCSSLEKLYLSADIPGIATSKYAREDIFKDCDNLKYISLSDCSLTLEKNYSMLPSPSGEEYSGFWIKTSGEPEEEPFMVEDIIDTKVLSAGVWQWAENGDYTIVYTADAGVGGSMAQRVVPTDEAFTLDKNLYYMLNHKFSHWSGSNGNTYEDEETIPANTFSAGSTLTLTAVFEEVINDLDFSEGEADVDLIGGEKITVSNLPGGTLYQIVEETPSGWQVIDTINVAGTIPPDGTINAVVTNGYVPGTASITLTAVKTLDGRAPEEGAFEFELFSVDDDAVVETVSNNASGIVQFEALMFTQPGVYTYEIREIRGDDPGISYDSHVETITIEVVDDGNGNLTATSSAQTSTPRFENETKPGSLTITKFTTGRSGDEIFTFEVTLTNEYGQSLDSVNILSPN